MKGKCGLCKNNRTLTKHTHSNQNVCDECIGKAGRRALDNICIRCNKSIPLDSRTKSWCHIKCNSSKPFVGY